jgi:transcriptional antiterminator NusG
MNMSTENTTPSEAEVPAEAQAVAMEAAPPSPSNSEGTSTSDVAAESESSEESATPAPKARTLKWYTVQTYSSYENRVRDSLCQRIAQHKMEEVFGDILVPTETQTDVLKSGKTRVRQKVSFPGYIFVEMVMTETSWHLVKDTGRVIGFLGDKTPKVVPIGDINNMRRGIIEGSAKPKPRLSFASGEEVRVLEGAFANFTGMVDEVNTDKQKLKVIVSIFGRSTPVELDFSNVEKR